MVKSSQTKSMNGKNIQTNSKNEKTHKQTSQMENLSNKQHNGKPIDFIQLVKKLKNKQCKQKKFTNKHLKGKS